MRRGLAQRSRSLDLATRTCATEASNRASGAFWRARPGVGGLCWIGWVRRQHIVRSNRPVALCHLRGSRRIEKRSCRSAARQRRPPSVSRHGRRKRRGRSRTGEASSDSWRESPPRHPRRARLTRRLHQQQQAQQQQGRRPSTALAPALMTGPGSAPATWVAGPATGSASQQQPRTRLLLSPTAQGHAYPWCGEEPCTCLSVQRPSRLSQTIVIR